jgi:ribulose-bisphosphate carboxylase large chain
MYLCGGGIIGHPGGIAAGIRSVRQAWDAALEGVPMETAASQSTELRQAMEQFGR